jgi:putative Mg2+ transporter-C (MgtC) family protein
LDFVPDDLRAGLAHAPEALRLGARLLAAMGLAAVIGYERQVAGKEAGLRTHILVAAGAALLVVAPLRAQMSPADLSRVIQGIVTGIGFLGAGAILKPDAARTVRGLTTAAGIWLTAAVGIAAGLGQYVLAGVATALGWAVLAWLGALERRAERRGAVARRVTVPAENERGGKSR